MALTWIQSGQPVGDQRVYLGQAVKVERATVLGFAQFSLKPGSKGDKYDFMDDVMDAGVCTLGTAAKLGGEQESKEPRSCDLSWDHPRSTST